MDTSMESLAMTERYARSGAEGADVAPVIVVERARPMTSAKRDQKSAP